MASVMRFLSMASRQTAVENKNIFCLFMILLKIYAKTFLIDSEAGHNQSTPMTRSIFTA